MVYGSINKIRGICGITPVYETKKQIGVGDNTETEFKLPAVGKRTGYLIDLDSSTTSTITEADVIVYVNDTPVTVSGIDEDAGTVTLAVAPSVSDVIKADYMWSEVSDEQIIDEMNIAKEIVDIVINGQNVVDQSYTQEIDGNGSETEFEFDHSDVSSITSITVDGVTQTIDTNYKLYKFAKSAFYWYIKFLIAPISENQNIVIVYNYGQNSYLIHRLSNLYASRQLILGPIKSSRSAGTFRKGDTGKSDGEVSRLSKVNSEIMKIVPMVDNRNKYGTA